MKSVSTFGLLNAAGRNLSASTKSNGNKKGQRLVKALVESLELRRYLSYQYVSANGGSNDFYMRLTPDGTTVQLYQNQSLTDTPAYTLPANSGEYFAISEDNGNSTFTIDFSNGDPMGGFFGVQTANPPPNGGDTINIINTGGANYTLNSAHLIVHTPRSQRYHQPHRQRYPNGPTYYFVLAIRHIAEQ